MKRLKLSATTIVACLAFLAFDLCSCFIVNQRSVTTTRYCIHVSSIVLRAGKDNAQDEIVAARGVLLDDTRRKSLGALLISPLALLLKEPALADTIIAEEEVQETNLDCLLDLPPIPKDHVRIFLCRHGQTENNRLRKVQGARVDPPINDNGILQATNMGKALSKVNPTPQSPFFSSNLKRAQMTAEIASNQINNAGNNNIPKPLITQLSSLAEVDFGPLAEGQPIAIAKVGMQATAARWAAGNIDYRPSKDGGDSARDVFNRAVESLRILTKEATTNSSSSVVAVAHSTFLRVLIALVLNESLVEAQNRKINNGSINVIDISKDFRCQTLGPKSNLIGGKLSLAPDDFSIDVPICDVVRVNESRHLPAKLPL